MARRSRSPASKSASCFWVGRSPLIRSQVTSSKQLSLASTSTGIPRYSSRAFLPSRKLTADLAAGTSSRPGRNSVSVLMGASGAAGGGGWGGVWWWLYIWWLVRGGEGGGRE